MNRKHADRQFELCLTLFSFFCFSIQGGAIRAINRLHRHARSLIALQILVGAPVADHVITRIMKTTSFLLLPAMLSQCNFTPQVAAAATRKRVDATALWLFWRCGVRRSTAVLSDVGLHHDVANSP